MLQSCADEKDEEQMKAVEALDPSDPNGIEGIPVKCVQFPLNMTCKILPSPRESFAGVIIQQRLFILGGYLEKDLAKGNKRDARVPLKTYIILYYIILYDIIYLIRPKSPQCHPIICHVHSGRIPFPSHLHPVSIQELEL